MNFQGIDEGDIVDYEFRPGAVVPLYIRKRGSEKLYAEVLERWFTTIFEEWFIKGDYIALTSARRLRKLAAAEIIQRGLELHGHRREHDFYPTAAELEQLPDTHAPLSETDKGDVVIAAHYTGPIEVWAAGYARGEGLGRIYGYTRPWWNADLGRWGYLDLVGLEQRYASEGDWRSPALMTRDVAWTPGPAREVIPGYRD